jgi:hypothetical protein
MSLPATTLTILRQDADAETRSCLPGDYVIGRGVEADIRIETPLISRAHARLIIRERECLIEDLGSSNGTFVNGERIGTVTVLRPEERIMLGPSVTLEIRQLPGPAPALSVASRRTALVKLLPPEFLHEKKYEIGNVIAEGGMGAVLDARELTIQRNVAMKVMLESEKPDEMMRFIAEAKITGQLEHPNIMPVHELGVDDKERLFYTMKYVRGCTLRQVLDALSDRDPVAIAKYPFGHLLTILQKVCDAVAFAHSKGVIHRDLKPENFMIGDYGEVLVPKFSTRRSIGRSATRAIRSFARDCGRNCMPRKKRAATSSAHRNTWRPNRPTRSMRRSMCAPMSTPSARSSTTCSRCAIPSRAKAPRRSSPRSPREISGRPAKRPQARRGCHICLMEKCRKRFPPWR